MWQKPNRSSVANQQVANHYTWTSLTSPIFFLNLLLMDAGLLTELWLAVSWLCWCLKSVQPSSCREAVLAKVGFTCFLIFLPLQLRLVICGETEKNQAICTKMSQAWTPSLSKEGCVMWQWQARTLLSTHYLPQRSHPGQAQLRLNQIKSPAYRQHLRKKQINLSSPVCGTTLHHLLLTFPGKFHC